MRIMFEKLAYRGTIGTLADRERSATKQNGEPTRRMQRAAKGECEVLNRKFCCNQIEAQPRTRAETLERRENYLELSGVLCCINSATVALGLMRLRRPSALFSAPCLIKAMVFSGVSEESRAINLAARLTTLGEAIEVPENLIRVPPGT